LAVILVSFRDTAVLGQEGVIARAHGTVETNSAGWNARMFQWTDESVLIGAALLGQWR
jgi:hypothetical protein